VCCCERSLHRGAGSPAGHPSIEDGTLIADISISLLRSASGFAIGGSIGFALGVAVGFSRTAGCWIPRS
jgi:sulfonate transport system permease protein